MAWAGVLCVSVSVSASLFCVCAASTLALQVRLEGLGTEARTDRPRNTSRRTGLAPQLPHTPPRVPEDHTGQGSHAPRLPQGLSGSPPVQRGACPT